MTSEPIDDAVERTIAAILGEFDDNPALDRASWQVELRNVIQRVGDVIGPELLIRWARCDAQCVGFLRDVYGILEDHATEKLSADAQFALRAIGALIIRHEFRRGEIAKVEALLYHGNLASDSAERRCCAKALETLQQHDLERYRQDMQSVVDKLVETSCKSAQ